MRIPTGQSADGPTRHHVALPVGLGFDPANTYIQRDDAEQIDRRVFPPVFQHIWRDDRGRLGRLTAREAAVRVAFEKVVWILAVDRARAPENAFEPLRRYRGDELGVDPAPRCVAEPGI